MAQVIAFFLIVGVIIGYFSGYLYAKWNYGEEDDE